MGIDDIFDFDDDEYFECSEFDTMRGYGLNAMVTAARLRKNMQAEGQEVMEL